MATLYFVIYPSALGDPSAAQIKAGQNATGASATASGNEVASTVTAEQIFASAATGLTAGTSYRVAFVWSDGTDDSEVAVSDAWATQESTVYTIDAQPGSLSATGATGSPLARRRMEGAAGSAAITGSDATTRAIRRIDAQAGSITLTGEDATVLAHRALSADAGSVTITGADASIGKIGAYALDAQPGAVSVTGQDAGLVATRRLSADAGSAEVTGADAQLQVVRLLSADAGQIVLTGADAELGRAGVYTLSADAGALTISGKVVEFVAPTRNALKPAGRSKYRRVILGDRLYEVLERDIPALLEAELLDRAPPTTAEVIEGPKPRRKRARKAPQPVKTVAEVRQAVRQIKRRIEPDNAWLMQALETVAQRVLERLQDEEDSLMLLLAA